VTPCNPIDAKTSERTPNKEGEACDESLPRELTGYLLSQKANRNDRQIGICRSHGLAHLRIVQTGSRPCQDDNVVQENGAQVALRIFGLCFGQKKNAPIGWSSAR